MMLHHLVRRKFTLNTGIYETIQLYDVVLNGGYNFCARGDHGWRQHILWKIASIGLSLFIMRKCCHKSQKLVYYCWIASFLHLWAIAWLKKICYNLGKTLDKDFKIHTKK